VDRHQGARAGALHRVARPLQVELVRHPRGQRVADVADQELERIARAREHGVGEQVEDQVGAGRGAGEHADDPGTIGPRAARLVPRVLQGLPGGLQEHPLLRIEKLGLAVADPEEEGVEAVDVVRLGHRAHEVGIGEHLGRHAERERLLLGEEAHRLDTRAHVLPETRGVESAREAPRQADDGDGAFQILQSVRHLCFSS
jgi:hypothetical protein